MFSTILMIIIITGSIINMIISIILSNWLAFFGWFGTCILSITLRIEETYNGRK